MSVIRHPVSCCWPEFKKSSAESNDSTDRPPDFSNRWTATRYDSSSSITATIFGVPSLPIQVQDRSARCIAQLWIVIGSRIDIYRGPSIVMGGLRLRLAILG